uniref:RNA-directed DNA polymerase n=1 Tax=Bos indicus x Bos taurus TaxID=30522 RepID=A0A4W2FDV3_BOBOX
MLKILQARLQQYVNRELPDVQAGFRKGRGTRDQIANIRWIIEKAREFQKNIYFCFIDYTKAFDCVDHKKLWKILEEMGIPDHLTCLLRNLYAGQEATVRIVHGTTDWFQIGKGVCQGCILSPCLFNFYAEYMMRNAGLEEAQAGIKIAGRNINNLRYADNTTLMADFIDYSKAFDCVDHNKLWKILKEMGIPDHLICLLRNLYAGQEATVRTGHGTTDWFQIGKGVCQGCILSPCLFNLYAEYIMRNTGLEETQTGIKIAGRNINNLRYADDTTLMAESEEELKSLLMKVKVESEKVGLNLHIQKTKIMASGPITSWEIDGETVETVSDFISGGSKITADGDCSHEIKRRLLLGRKVMTNLDSIFKSRDTTLPTKVCLVKALVFPVVMYGCKSWTVKKAEC